MLVGTEAPFCKNQLVTVRRSEQKIAVFPGAVFELILKELEPEAVQSDFIRAYKWRVQLNAASIRPKSYLSTGNALQLWMRAMTGPPNRACAAEFRTKESARPIRRMIWALQNSPPSEQLISDKTLGRFTARRLGGALPCHGPECRGSCARTILG